MVLGPKKVGGGAASIWLGRNKRRKLAVSRRFNFSELISLDRSAGRWWKSTGRREVDKERPNGMNGTVGGGQHRPRKWDLQAMTRERESACMVQVEFSSGRSRCSCCSRVCIVFTSSSHPPWATLFPCFSLLFHPFRRCAPRSFPPRLSFFIRRRPRFARVYRIDCIFAGKYCEIGVKPKISRRIGLEMVVGKDSYLGYRSFESQVDIYETRWIRKFFIFEIKFF